MPRSFLVKKKERRQDVAVRLTSFQNNVVKDDTSNRKDGTMVEKDDAMEVVEDHMMELKVPEVTAVVKKAPVKEWRPWAHVPDAPPRPERPPVIMEPLLSVMSPYSQLVHPLAVRIHNGESLINLLIWRKKVLVDEISYIRQN